MEDSGKAGMQREGALLTERAEMVRWCSSGLNTQVQSDPGLYEEIRRSSMTQLRQHYLFIINSSAGCIYLSLDE